MPSTRAATPAQFSVYLFMPAVLTKTDEHMTPRRSMLCSFLLSPISTIILLHTTDLQRLQTAADTGADELTTWSVQKVLELLKQRANSTS
jgi:hypothetical protein